MARQLALAVAFWFCSSAVIHLHGAETGLLHAERSRIDLPAPVNVLRKNCTIENQVYDCTPLFDWRTPASKPDGSVDVNALSDIVKGLVDRGTAWHAGDKIMKVLLMTKNEYPLIATWTYHHGHVLGFANLYILDASTDARVKSFLDHASGLGVNVIHSQANLNQADHVMTNIFTSLRGTCDFLIKLDTDEFLVAPDAANSITFDRVSLIKTINELPFTGAKYDIGGQVKSLHRKGCSLEDNTPLHSTWFSRPENLVKKFFSSWTVEHVDLGSHQGNVLAPFRALPDQKSHLMVLHYHNHCYPRQVASAKQAILSHGYVAETDAQATQIEKLETCLRQRTCTSSSHKVGYYLAFLRNATAAEASHRAMWQEGGSGRARDSVVQLERAARYMRGLHAVYEPML